MEINNVKESKTFDVKVKSAARYDDILRRLLLFGTKNLILVRKVTYGYFKPGFSFLFSPNFPAISNNTKIFLEI